MESTEVYRLLTRRIPRGLIIFPALCFASTIFVAVAWFTLGSRALTVVGFLAGILSYQVFALIREWIALARRVSEQPELVYWAHSTWQSESEVPLEHCTSLILHFRDGAQLEVALPPAEMRHFVGWLCERNSSAADGRGLNAFLEALPDEIKRRAWYQFAIGGGPDSTGMILAVPGNVRWRYTTEACRPTYFPQNLFRKPEFVLLEEGGTEILRVRRRTRFPPRFDITRNGTIVGTIWLRSILRIRYTITLNTGPTWTFRMPLFTVRFGGESDTHSRVWVVVGPSKKQWNLSFDPGADDMRLLAALAFIHRESWYYR